MSSIVRKKKEKQKTKSLLSLCLSLLQPLCGDWQAIAFGICWVLASLCSEKHPTSLLHGESLQGYPKGYGIIALLLETTRPGLLKG